MTEMGRRKEMKEEYQKNQAQGSTTVAEDILSPAANMARGLGAMAQPQNRMATQPQNLPIEQSMATMPPSPQPMANKLPVTRMADGGLAKIKARNGMSLAYDPSYVGSLFPGGSFSPEAFRELYLGQVPADQQRQSSVRSGLRAGSDVGAGTFYTPRGAMEAAFPSDMDARTKAIEAVAATYKQPSIFSRIFNRSGDATPEIAGYPTAEAAAAAAAPASASASAPSKLVPGGYSSQPDPFALLEFDPKRLEPNIPAPEAPAAPAVDISALLPQRSASPAAGFNTNFGPYEERLKAAAGRKQPAVTYSPSLTGAEAAAQKALTDAQAGLTADSAYKDLATALTDRRDAIGGQRDEAAGLALLEAAARIAGSKSPFITQAIGEAAPAIASYGKSLSEVRKQENALFDAEAKLTQLEVAEAAGRKDEVSKLRGELRDLDKVRRDVDEKAFNRFEKTRNLEINVIKAEQQFATARTTEARENARFRLSAAKDAREENSLANQLGETQANIVELEDLLRSGKSRSGQPLTDAEKAAVQNEISSLGGRADEISKRIKSTKKDDYFSEQARLRTFSGYRTNIEKLAAELGAGTRENYISINQRKYGSPEAAGKRYDEIKIQLEDLRVRASQLARSLGGAVPPVSAPAGGSGKRTLEQLRKTAAGT
jgi:hypothetical protein